MTQFKDVEFMTAKEKELVCRQWRTFVEGGFQRKHFTNRIYQHLSLHCSFIAHYDINGFYDVYFSNDRLNTLRFIEQFTTGKSAEMGMDYWIGGDYADLNPAMMEIMQINADKLTTKLSNNIQTEELGYAQKIAGKYGMTLS